MAYKQNSGATTGVAIEIRHRMTKLFAPEAGKGPILRRHRSSDGSRRHVLRRACKKRMR
jgi:hypothetical protein